MPTAFEKEIRRSVAAEADRARIRKVRAFLDAAKCNGCIQCGETRLPALDFHHRDPANKAFGLGDSSQLRSVAMARIEAEVDKCDVLCSNCHRCLHAEERVHS